MILSNETTISLKIGEVKSAHLDFMTPELRKRNRVKTIYSSLSIEGNTLSEDQITLLLNNKKIAGPKNDIIEVKNAILLYESIKEYNPFSEKSFLKAHKVLMNNIMDRPGKYRTGDVGIVKGDKVSHLPPPARNISKLMGALFDYLKNEHSCF